MVFFGFSVHKGSKELNSTKVRNLGRVAYNKKRSAKKNWNNLGIRIKIWVSRRLSGMCLNRDLSVEWYVGMNLLLLADGC